MTNLKKNGWSFFFLYCEIIVVCGVYVFTDFVSLSSQERIKKTLILRMQSSYPFKYVQTNQQNFNNIQTLAPTNKNDSKISVLQFKPIYINVPYTPSNVTCDQFLKTGDNSLSAVGFLAWQWYLRSQVFFIPYARLLILMHVVYPKFFFINCKQFCMLIWCWRY